MAYNLADHLHDTYVDQKMVEMAEEDQAAIEEVAALQDEALDAWRLVMDAHAARKMHPHMEVELAEQESTLRDAFAIAVERWAEAAVALEDSAEGPQELDGQQSLV